MYTKFIITATALLFIAFSAFGATPNKPSVSCNAPTTANVSSCTYYEEVVELSDLSSINLSNLDPATRAVIQDVLARQDLFAEKEEARQAQDDADDLENFRIAFSVLVALLFKF